MAAPWKDITIKTKDGTQKNEYLVRINGEVSSLKQIQQKLLRKMLRDGVIRFNPMTVKIGDKSEIKNETWVRKAFTGWANDLPFSKSWITPQAWDPNYYDNDMKKFVDEWMSLMVGV